MPFGVFAKNPVLEHDGEYEGTKYHHKSIVLVGSGSAPSGFNPYRLERIQAGDTAWGPKSFVERYKKDPALRFVSDGNPKTITYPRKMKEKSNRELGSKYQIIETE